MKKFIGFLLVISLLFTACGTTKPDSLEINDNTSADLQIEEPEVTLDLICYEYSKNSKDIWQNIKTGFEEENGNITLNVTLLPWEEANVEINTRILNGESLDVFVTDDLESYINKGILVSAENYSLNEFKDRVLYNIDSSMGLPIAGDDFRLFINKNVGDACGINESSINNVGWDAITHGMEHMSEFGITKDFFIEVNDNAYELSKNCLLKSTGETEGTENLTNVLLGLVAGDKDIRRKTAYDGVLSVLNGEIGMAIAPRSIRYLLDEEYDTSSLMDYELPGETYVLSDSFGVLNKPSDNEEARLLSIKKFFSYFYGTGYDEFLLKEGFIGTLKNM